MFAISKNVIWFIFRRQNSILFQNMAFVFTLCYVKRSVKSKSGKVFELRYGDTIPVDMRTSEREIEINNS